MVISCQELRAWPELNDWNYKMAHQRESKRLSKTQQRRKQDILEASLKIFDRDGFEAAKMSAIAEEADVAKGTLYLYFDSKAALLEGVIQSAIIPTLRTADVTAQSHDGTAGDLLKKQMRIMVDRMASPEMQMLLRYMMSGRTKQHQRITQFYFENVVQKGIELLGETIQQGVDSGEFRSELSKIDPLVLLGSQIYTTVWKSLFEGLSPINTDNLNRDLLELLLTGLHN